MMMEILKKLFEIYGSDIELPDKLLQQEEKKKKMPAKVMCEAIYLSEKK